MEWLVVFSPEGSFDFSAIKTTTLMDEAELKKYIIPLLLKLGYLRIEKKTKRYWLNDQDLVEKIKSIMPQ